MDSSDEELFVVTPKIRNCNDTPIKDVLVNLTRLSNVKLRKEQKNMHLFKKKRRKIIKEKKLWNFKRNCNISGKSQQAFKKIDSIAEARSELLEHMIDENTHTSLDKQSHEVVKKSENAQHLKRNIESFILSMCETKNKEKDSCANETCVSARSLPYEIHQKMILSNDTNAVNSDPLSTLSSCSKDIEQSLHIDKIYASGYTSPEKLINRRKTLTAREISVKSQLDKYKFKRRRIESDEELFDMPTISKRRCRKISSDTSSSEVSNANSMNMIGESNWSESHSSREQMEQEKLRTSIQISREARVTLTRLEDMVDADVIKWQESKMQNASEIIIFEPQAEKQQFDVSEVMKRSDEKKSTPKKQSSHVIKHFRSSLTARYRRNKLILREGDCSSKTKDIHKDSSELLIVSNIHVEKHHPTRSNNSLNMKKLRKKYNLFKKPRILMIKLETLQVCSKGGTYSATEIDCVMKKYLKFVINSSSSSRFHESLLYGSRQLQRTNMTDVNITCTKHDNVRSSMFGRQSVNENFKQLAADKSPITDNQITENSNDVKNTYTPFKIRRKFIPTVPVNHNELNLPEIPKTKKSTSPRTTLQIWRNAFFTQKSAGVLQETTVEQSASVQISEIPSVPRNSSKESADVKCQSVFSPCVASTSTSSTKDNTLVTSPVKLVSLEKQVDTPATLSKCNVTSKSELSVSETNIEEIISKSDFSKSKDNAVSKSWRKNITEESIVSHYFLNSSKKDLKKISLRSSEKISNVESSISDTTPVKTKTSEMYYINQSSCKKMQTPFKCVTCAMTFKNSLLLQTHKSKNLCKMPTILNPLPSNALKDMGFFNEQCMTKWQEMIMDKIHKHSSESLKPSTSQDHPSIEQESSSCKSDRSFVGSDRKTVLPSSSLSKNHEMRRKHFWSPQMNARTKLFIKSKSDLNRISQSRIGTLREFKHIKKCKICSQVFETYQQLYEHTLKHMDKQHQEDTYVSNKDEIDSARQETNENNSKNSTIENSVEIEAVVEEIIESAENCVNVQEKKPSENTNSNADDRIALEVLQCNTAKAGNKTSNLSQAKYTIEQDSQEQSIIAMNNAEHITDKTQCMEREKKCGAATFSRLQRAKSLTICQCHQTKSVEGDNIQIEIVLLCTTCQTLFRRLDCFKTHCQRPIEGTLCIKNRLDGRKPKLFCNVCLEAFDSIQAMWRHLKMHTRFNHKGTATFCCNICKVMFYGPGPLFKNHFHNHMKNPFFLASRLSFPSISYVGTKLCELSATDSDKPHEVYLQVADYVCEKCKTPFATKVSLKSHEVICQVNVATVIDKSSDGNLQKNASSFVSKKMHILLLCGFCNKTFYSRKSFELHSLEHKQKQKLHSHYTCVSVTAITNLFICKVCMTMWQSLKNFEEHWLTHGTLQEDYICSHCQNHYDTFDQFEDHVITHKDSDELQQGMISCKVIYRDIGNLNCKTNLHAVMDSNNLPRTSLSYFEGKESVSDKPRELEKPSTTLMPQNSMLESRIVENNQSTRIEVIVSPRLSIRKEPPIDNYVDLRFVPEQVFPIDTTVTQSKRVVENSNMICTEDCSGIDNNVKNKNNDGNLQNLDDSEEENLVIDMSESKESSMSNEVRRKDGNESFVKRNDTQESATMSKPASISDKRKRSNDVFSEISSDSSSDSNSNIQTNVTVLKNIAAQSKTSATVSNHIKVVVGDKNIESSISKKDSASKSSIICQLNLDEKESLPKNVMTVMPKSFLRVKSLAELTNSLEKVRCEICDILFDSLQKLMEHKSTHVVPSAQDKQDSQVSSSGNVHIWSKSKPKLTSFMHMPTTQIQSQPLQSVTIVSKPNNTHSNKVIQLLDATNSKQYQIIGKKPLRAVTHIPRNSMMPNKTSQAVTIFSQQNNSTVTAQLQQTGYHQNLPSQVAYPLISLAQPAHQQQNIHAVAVRPFIQNYQGIKQLLSPYSHQPPLYSQQSPSYSQPPETYLQQQQQRQQQQQQQRQHWQPQQQQLQELQQMTIGNNDYLGYLHSVAPNNVMPTNSGNIMLMTLNTTQVSKHP